jgi:hypothetical protein
MLFMAIALAIVTFLPSGNPGEPDTGFVSSLKSGLWHLVMVPSWGLPIAFSYLDGGHHPNIGLGTIGLMLHLLLWLVLWDWKDLVTWFRKKR